ncbi:MAG: hypothetical protein OER88_06425, partial [Planctomycetota bacterium]|nr:hypothetical protein [Planctomycetota bacterium]
MVVMRDESHENESTGLHKPQDASAMPPPLAAMAEALRANAEALHRINESQQKMAETMERTDKSAQIITSTRALNETFRSLSDIQRGLLDAVVERGGMSFGVVLLLILVFMVLAGLGGFWAAERWGTTQRPEQAAAHMAAIQKAGDLERDFRQIELRFQEAKDDAAQWRSRHDAGAAERQRLERERDAARAGKAPLELRIKELEGELGTQKARLENFLEVKAQADQAGVLQQRNVILEQENRQLQKRVEEIEGRNKAMQEFFGNKLLDGKLGDPEAIKAIARELGLYTEPDLPDPKADAAGGPVVLTARGRRVLEQQLRRLLPDQADETIQVLSIRAIEG